MKFDKEKVWWSHIPLKGIEKAAEIITKKAIKFKEKRGFPGWLKLDSGKERYFDALTRHLFELNKGHLIDLDSGFNHSELIIANAIILDDIYRNESS